MHMKTLLAPLAFRRMRNEFEVCDCGIHRGALGETAKRRQHRPLLQYGLGILKISSQRTMADPQAGGSGLILELLHFLLRAYHGLNG